MSKKKHLQRTFASLARIKYDFLISACGFVLSMTQLLPLNKADLQALMHFSLLLSLSWFIISYPAGLK